jgi:hypothetical protein
MAVQVMNDGRPRFTSSEGRLEEIKVAFKGYTAYFGTFEVNEKEGYVRHHMVASLSPNEVGMERKRFFEFCGNRLTLTTPIEVDGESLVRRIVWVRMGSVS